MPTAPRPGMTSLELIDQGTHSPAFRAQNGQTDDHEENPLQYGETFFGSYGFTFALGFQKYGPVLDSPPSTGAISNDHDKTAILVDAWGYLITSIANMDPAYYGRGDWRHSGGANVLFGDFRVEWMHLREVLASHKVWLGCGPQ